MTFLVSVRVPERGVGRRAQRDVDVGAHVAALHPRLGDAERTEDVPQVAHVGGGATSGARSPTPVIGLVTISTSGMPARL